MWDDGPHLSEHDVLSADTCRQLGERVLAMRSSWTPRSGFFTLGAAAYLDAVQAPARRRYFAGAPGQNAMLEASFGDLYDDLAAAIGDIVDDDVAYDASRPWPGFHVFLEAPQGARPSGAHFDLQWRHAWPNRAPKGTLSFTIPIAQPPEGASLDVWHLQFTEANDRAIVLERYIEDRAPLRVPYTPGRMVVHDGNTLHAIGRSPVRGEGPRITMQGHGWQTDRGWVLYW